MRLQHPSCWQEQAELDCQRLAFGAEVPAPLLEGGPPPTPRAARQGRGPHQLPEAHINAINEALGVKGPFVPLGPPLETENGEGEIDTEILPQD